jgi:hypothetical protein
MIMVAWQAPSFIARTSDAMRAGGKRMTDEVHCWKCSRIIWLDPQILIVMQMFSELSSEQGYSILKTLGCSSLNL